MSAGQREGRALRILFVSRSFPPQTGDVATHNGALCAALSTLTDVRLLANRHGDALLPLFLPLAAAYAALSAPRYGALLLGDGVTSVVGWFAKKLHRKTPVVCVLHGPDLAYASPRSEKWWLRRFLPAADLFVAVDREAEDAAVAEGLPFMRMVVLPSAASATGEGAGRGAPAHDDPWRAIALRYLEEIAGRFAEDTPPVLTI